MKSSKQFVVGARPVDCMSAYCSQNVGNSKRNGMNGIMCMKGCYNLGKFELGEKPVVL